MGLSDDLVAFLVLSQQQDDSFQGKRRTQSTPHTQGKDTTGSYPITDPLQSLGIRHTTTQGTRLSQFADYIATYSLYRNPGEARDRLQAFNTAITHCCAKWRIILATNKMQIIGMAKEKIHETHT